MQGGGGVGWDVEGRGRAGRASKYEEHETGATQF